MTFPLKSALAMGLALLAAGCQVAERLAEVGREPPLRPIENPKERPGYRPVSLPMPDIEPQVSAGANSLWRSGAKGFFRDQRARRVGDVLTVQVTIKDKAELSNESTRSRRTTDDLGVPALFGLQNLYEKIMPNPVDPANLVEAQSGMTNLGRGEVNRDESINVNLAAIITQVLPNGNLVVEGKQEVRVNYELREIVVAGIVRPEDITPKNTIGHEKMAELRVGYGGRGHISDVQQPRYGAQVLDILLPY